MKLEDYMRMKPSLNDSELELYKHTTLYALIYECVPNELKGLIEPKKGESELGMTGHAAYHKLLNHYLGNIGLYKQSVKNEFHNIQLENNESFEHLLIRYEKLIRQMELLGITEEEEGKKITLINAVLGRNDACGRDIHARLKLISENSTMHKVSYEEWYANIKNGMESIQQEVIRLQSQKNKSGSVVVVLSNKILQQLNQALY